MKRVAAALLILAVLAAVQNAGGGIASSSNYVPGNGERLVRLPVDTVGYATAPSEVESVLRISNAMETARFNANEKSHPVICDRGMLAAICPHDDYLYAGPVYAHVFRYYKAPVVIMFGVSHAARRMGIEGKLIFESFNAWKGPYGQCPVTDLRRDLLDALPQKFVLVDNELHSGEHSLEAFVPFIQRCFASGGAGSNALPRILPILATRFKGRTQGEAADTLASILAAGFEERGWKLGEDVQILISADCVHYGDENWGGRNYAPYGTGREGYQAALRREMEVIDSSLAGTVGPERIASFRLMVERDDLEWPYKITWCGVYSIPFGLSTLYKLTELAEGSRPEGILLRYGTSLEPGRLDVEEGDLGVTNIATYRHWVGYAAVGYW